MNLNFEKFNPVVLRTLVLSKFLFGKKFRKPSISLVIF